MDKKVSVTKIHMNLYGMTCANCVSRIERKVKNINGVRNVSVNLALETGSIEFEDFIDVEEILTTIENIGYGVSIRKSVYDESSKEKKDLKNSNYFNLLFSSLLTFPLILPMFIHKRTDWIFEFFFNPIFQILVSFPVVFIFGRRFHKNAYLTLKDLSPGMDTLISIGTISSFVYSIYLGFFTVNSSHLYFETASMLITLVLLGKYLEEKAKQRTSIAIEKLLKLRPKKVLVVRDGKEELLDIDSLKEGDICIIKPGENIPADGNVIEGISEVNESMISGESIPVIKQKNDFVYGGTLNISGFIRVQTNALGEKSLLTKIINLVSDAQSSKAPIQKLVDKISYYFVPVILIFSILSFIVTYFFISPGSTSDAFEHALSVLVIACPCALGLATPASIIAGSGRAAEYGILFKNSESLENAHKCGTIVFDKTGTLTKGSPTVSEIYATEKFSKESILEYASIAEKFSPHPFGKAIISASEILGISISTPDEFEYLPGIGTVARFSGNIIRTGSYRILNPKDVDEYISKISELEKKGHSVIYVYLNEIFLGFISLLDPLKENSHQLIQNLKDEGKDIILLSGDKIETTEYIGKLLGINNIIADVKPEEKSLIIRNLSKNGKKIMMVGDGINDSPALATAYIGVSMGNGSDIAIEAGDVTLLKSRMEGIRELLFFSKMTYKNIQQNLFWALIYNFTGVPLAFFGFLPPWLAGMAMALSSISVILNSLRLQKLKPIHKNQSKGKNFN